MNNKVLFLLPLFLLLPTATQCMEKEIVFKPKTMQEIQDERSEIYKNFLTHERNMQCDSRYKKYNPLDSYAILTNQILFQTHSLDSDDLRYPQLQDFHFKEYSYLTLAIIAIQRPKFEADYDTWGQMCNYHLMQNPKQAPFKEKKEAIQALLKIKLQPTDKDRYFALLTKYDEFMPLIIKKKLLLQNSSLLSEINIPQEIIPLISLLMWDTEESLF